MQVFPLSGRPCLKSCTYDGVRIHSQCRSPCLVKVPCHRPQPLRKSCILQGHPIVQEAIGGLLAENPGIVWGLAANSTVFVLGIKVLLSGLTWAGVLHSWFLGSTVYSAFGLGGYILVCLYFLLGSLDSQTCLSKPPITLLKVTKVKLQQKKDEGIAEARSGRRSVGSVWGSGLAGVFCAIMGLVTGNFKLWQVGFVASFGSKLSDTVSSEIGKAYGKTTYLITTLEKCPRGTEGAVSLEGTLAGFLAALGYGLVAYLLGQVTMQGSLVVFAACVVANLFESYLGASIQGEISWLTNDAINMLQISVAAGLAIVATVAL